MLLLYYMAFLSPIDVKRRRSVFNMSGKPLNWPDIGLPLYWTFAFSYPDRCYGIVIAWIVTLSLFASWPWLCLIFSFCLLLMVGLISYFGETRKFAESWWPEEIPDIEMHLAFVHDYSSYLLSWTFSRKIFKHTHCPT